MPAGRGHGRSSLLIAVWGESNAGGALTHSRIDDRSASPGGHQREYAIPGHMVMTENLTACAARRPLHDIGRVVRSILPVGRTAAPGTAQLSPCGKGLPAGRSTASGRPRLRTGTGSNSAPEPWAARAFGCGCLHVPTGPGVRQTTIYADYSRLGFPFRGDAVPTGVRPARASRGTYPVGIRWPGATAPAGRLRSSGARSSASVPPIRPDFFRSAFSPGPDPLAG